MGVAMSGCAQLLHDRDPVETRQAEVENDGFVVFGFGAEPSFLAVVNDVDHIARVRQGGRDFGRDGLFVFDDQDSHFRHLI